MMQAYASHVSELSCVFFTRHEQGGCTQFMFPELNQRLAQSWSFMNGEGVLFLW